MSCDGRHTLRSSGIPGIIFESLWNELQTLLVLGNKRTVLGVVEVVMRLPYRKNIITREADDVMQKPPETITSL